MNRLLIVGGIVFGFFVIAHAMAVEPRDEKRTIPLSEIITTGPQKDLRSLRDAWEKDTKQPTGSYDIFMRQVDSINNGGSNVFVVDATNLYGALSASLDVLTRSRRTDTLAHVSTSQPERGSHWMVAYLGSGPSNPTWWTVESVRIERGRVVLSYKESPPRPATADVRHYYYWIPLGKLAPGTFEVQLFDADKKATALMRRVEVNVTTKRE